MDKKQVLEEFEKEGQTASFFYADDTVSGDWRHGMGHASNCKKLWDEHPELHDEMRIIRKRFIMQIGD